MPILLRGLLGSLAAATVIGLSACESTNADDTHGDAAPDANSPDATPDVGPKDAGASCFYRDFRGNDVVCPAGNGFYPDGRECPSPDGCNYVTCYGGRLMRSASICGCWFSVRGLTFDGKDHMGLGTATADDGCTVCTCGKDTGGARIERYESCDSSACK